MSSQVQAPGQHSARALGRPQNEVMFSQGFLRQAEVKCGVPGIRSSEAHSRSSRCRKSSPRTDRPAVLSVIASGALTSYNFGRSTRAQNPLEIEMGLRYQF